MGEYPSNEEIDNYVEELKEKNEDYFEFKDFLLIYVKNFSGEKDHTEELLQAFRILDNANNGTIDIENLLHRLTHEGEKFSEKQAQEFYDIVKQNFKDDKMVNYKLLTKILINSYSRS